MSRGTGNGRRKPPEATTPTLEQKVDHLNDLVAGLAGAINAIPATNRRLWWWAFAMGACTVACATLTAAVVATILTGGQNT